MSQALAAVCAWICKPLTAVGDDWKRHRSRSENTCAYLHFDYNGDMERLNAVAALAALAHETRFDVFRLLVQAGPEGMPAGRIGDRLGLPSATLSFHLSHLRHAGLVTFRRESRSLIYMAEYPAMNDLLAYLTANCCQGDASGCGVGVCDSTTLIAARKGSARQ